LANIIVDGIIPDPITVSGDESALAQIIGPDGSVVASSENIDGEGPISTLQPAPDQILHGVASDLPVDTGSFRLAAMTVSTDEGTYFVYVANTVERRTEAIAALVTALLVGIPLLSVVVAWTSWSVIGKTLQPVEEIRAEVEEITGSQLHRRVPESRRADEIARLATTMNTMLDRLEHAAAQQDEFVADAAHELRSPLAGIRAELEVDVAHPRPESWEEMRDSVLTEAIRMQVLVDDLLLLARSEGESRIREDVDLDDLVGQALARVPLRDGVSVDSSGVSAGRVQGDASQLLRVVLNLLSNANRHAMTMVVVAVAPGNGAVELSVADDGAGVREEDRSRIFSRFTRSDEARSRDEGGSGLGLAIAAEIVHRHGGELTVGTSVLGGAVFTAIIPTLGG
jgi:signal transduction histidine kinase